MGWDYGYYTYKSASANKESAKKALERLKKKNPDISPVVISGRKLAKTWWGNAWNKNLESYADYSNRIGRGSAYVKNGMVLDLRIEKGVINALVCGSRKEPYKVRILIDKLNDKKWESIKNVCSHRIASATELAEGRFPEDLAQVFLRQGDGLFPSPKEIHLDCSCPDWADMCKHIAAVLYGVGARLDDDPLMFFTLRDIDFAALIKKSVDDKIDSMLKNAGKKSKRIMKDADIYELFGFAKTSP
jgi:uncharacterized Zn finger protein